MPNNLPEDYYLDNFHYVLNFVSRNYVHLLSAQEIGFTIRFRGMSINARRLYVRLANRKGPFFRFDKIMYAEISDISSALNELLQFDLARFVAPNIDDAVRLCSKTELLTLAEFTDWPRSCLLYTS